MKKISDKNKLRLEKRSSKNALRSLDAERDLVDFSSNDYLGFSRSAEIFDAAHQYLVENNIKKNGATGSRLLTGNHTFYKEVESMLCEFHESEAALIFNSGYDANIGFFSCVPQRGDIILYDELIHASIRDGITMSHAKAYKFQHNNLQDLNEKISRYTRNDLEQGSLSFRTDMRNLKREVYLVTESVFSMDGDTPDLRSLAELCEKHQAYLVVDEAHAVGIFGKQGRGVIQDLGLDDKIFARIVTFGKALGCHGAAILSSRELKQYLINFARSFVYTTGLPPHSLATIKAAYNNMVMSNAIEQATLLENIEHFKSEVKSLHLDFIESDSAIHCCIISDIEKVKMIELNLQEKGYDVKAILSPTVPEGKERLRFCLHAYNSKKEISEVLRLLSIFVNKVYES